jgi:hypothetical protein
MARLIFAVIAVAFIASCSGVGLVATDDPYVKVAQAKQMGEAGRAAQARRLLNEAMTTFQAKGDDLGMAEAHRQFGFLARTGGAREGVILVRDPETTPLTQEDWDLSDRHFKEAADLYARNNRTDMVANVYLNLGIGSALRGDKTQSCAYFDQSLATYRQWEAVHPGGKVELPRNIKSFADLIARAKLEAGCAA